MPEAGGLPAEAVFTDYNELGVPTKTSGIEVDAQEHLYSKYGETLRLTLGDGADKSWVTNYFQEGTRRPDQTIVDRNTTTGYRLADRTYTYDPAGIITRIADQPKGPRSDVPCFGYDHLRRMTRAFTPASGDCAVAPSTATLGGAAPHWYDYTFDKTGNRVSEVNLETQVNGTTIRSGPLKDPHTPIDPPTLRPGDIP
ncbi:hypothetical protein ALI22I_07905 [Saccharothrix sp. ALI-22-I]|nr:hypothetical protein ALI22I_07905 [Saccharothrix sp. ALI-22-I]